MITLTNIKQEKVLHILYAVVFLFFSVNCGAQTKVFATALGVPSVNVDNATFGYDGLVATKADVRARSNVVLVSPAYEGYIELQFPTTLPANTTSYVKISTDDNLLSSLLGGSLGDLLGSLVGVLLTGNQEFTVEAKLDGGAAVLSGSSTLPAQFGTDRLRLVQSTATPTEYFIRITPDQPYNRIRLTNKVGSALLGLGTIKKLYVYDAYYISGAPVCGVPTYTSYSGTGIVSVASTNVQNVQFAIDASTTNYSTLNIGLLGVGPSIEQTVYFEGLSQSTDSFGINLALASGLLGLDVLSNVTIIASNGGVEVQSKSLAQLLSLSLLTMQGGVMTTIPMTPGAPIDRITVRFSSFLSLGIIAQSLDFYGVTKTLAAPLITQNKAICQGNTASLIATGPASGAQLKWYDAASGGTLLATKASGDTFVTPILAATKTFYVSQVLGACEGFLLPVVVTVLVPPSAGVIGGDQTVCLTKTPVGLTSVSADTGTGIGYQWESSEDGVTWTVISGANLVTYQPDILLKTTFFRRTTTVSSGGVSCSSIPTNSIKVTTRNCIVISNPMARQRIKNGA